MSVPSIERSAATVRARGYAMLRSEAIPGVELRVSMTSKGEVFVDWDMRTSMAMAGGFTGKGGFEELRSIGLLLARAGALAVHLEAHPAGDELPDQPTESKSKESGEGVGYVT